MPRPPALRSPEERSSELPAALRTGLRAHLALGAALLVVLGAGCASPKAVGELATRASGTTSGLLEMAEDLEGTCRRQVIHEQLGDKSRQLDLETLEASCPQAAETSKTVRSAVLVVRSYFSLLGALADDRFVSFDAELASLEESLKATKEFDEAEVGAVGSLVSLISRAVTDTYRRRQLQVAIETADPHLARILEGLGAVIEEYEALLTYEEDALVVEIEVIGERYGENEPLGYLRYLESRKEAMERLAERRKAAAALKRSLGLLGEAHRDLVEAEGDWKRRQLISDLVSYGERLERLSEEVDDVF